MLRPLLAEYGLARPMLERLTGEHPYQCADVPAARNEDRLDGGGCVAAVWGVADIWGTERTSDEEVVR